MTLIVKNPFDQSVVAEVGQDSDGAVAAKLAAAAAAQRSWRHRPLPERIARVERALAWFDDRRESIARDITRQMGKPITEARREVDTMADRARATIALAPEALAPEILPPKPGFVRRVEHRPLGVIFDIVAWNYPLLIPINVIVPALLAGNAVVLKHSPMTPLTGQVFADAFAHTATDDPDGDDSDSGGDGGGDGGLVQHLVISHAQAARVIADRRIAHVCFTGSVRGGREVHRAAADRFIDVGLELGGKDAAYVAADADMAYAVAGIVDGACYNAGQSCCAVERVYVHRSRYDEFLAAARDLMGGYVMGDPLDEATTLGPLAYPSAPAFLANQVQDALDRGARLLAGGIRVPDTRANFYPPTLIADVSRDAEVMRRESFGPVLPVAAVDDDDEALARMDDSDYGLTASVWTADSERAERFADRLEVGTVFQNRCDYLDPALPWTGARDSGKGATLSRSGFFHLTRRKSIHFRTET